MKTWAVTIPIAGHAHMEVEAETQEEAIEKAMDKVTIDDVDEWEQLTKFHQGNVCYCPSPWEAVAEDIGEVDD